MLCYFLVLFLKLHPFVLSALLSLLLSPSPWHACFHCHQLQMDTRQDTNPAPTTWAGRKCRPCSPLPVRDPARAEPAPARAAPSHYGVLIYSCLKLWSAMQTSASIPAVPVQEGPGAHVASLCMHRAGSASCLLSLATTQKGGICLQGGAEFLGECWKQTSQRRKVLQTLFLQPARQSSKNDLASPTRHEPRTLHQQGVPWAERQTPMCRATINTWVLFTRQWKNTTKAWQWKDVKAGSQWGKCSFAANGSAGDLQRSVFTSALPLMKSQLGKQYSHWIISCRCCGNAVLLLSLKSLLS